MKTVAMRCTQTLSLLLCCAGASSCGSATGGFAADAAATSSASGFTSPHDTVPTSDGAVFYFTASNAAGAPGVFMVPAAGGVATQLTAGAPLVAPNGIAISLDDQTLYVADTTAGIFRLAVTAGTPTLIPGTAATHPRGLDVTRSSGADLLYFTGDDPASGMGGVFTIPAAGGSPTTLVKGSPLSTPVGVVVAKNGDVYVTNPSSFSATAPAGSVYKISGGTASVFVGSLTLGYPAGLALDLTNTTLLVSGLDSPMGHAVVYSINVNTTALQRYNQGIGQHTGAGGLHRAAAANIFGWCGTMVGSSGTVFRVTL